MRLKATDPRAESAIIRLDGRIMHLVTEADDVARYVDVIRTDNEGVVAVMKGPDGEFHPIVDRLHGRVAITLSRSSRIPKHRRSQSTRSSHA